MKSWSPDTWENPDDLTWTVGNSGSLEPAAYNEYTRKRAERGGIDNVQRKFIVNI